MACLHLSSLWLKVAGDWKHLIQLLLAIDVPRGLELVESPVFFGYAKVLSLLEICRAIWRHIAEFGFSEMPEIPEMDLDDARGRM